jgi:hypothetical protein
MGAILECHASGLSVLLRSRREQIVVSQRSDGRFWRKAVIQKTDGL